MKQNLITWKKRFTKLEEKFVDMEKDKESRVKQVEELHLLLLVQKEKVNELQFKLKKPLLVHVFYLKIVVLI